MSIEDKIFAEALSAQRLHRTKQMYNKAKLPHRCSMCGEDNDKLEIGYALDIEFVSDLSDPYIFICEDCYKELENDTTENN